MSKMDDLRAMREAKYARAQERGAPRTAGPSTTAAKRAPRRAAAPTPAATESAAETSTETATETATETSEELCGHRNMGGRTCTRERGHTAKSHRYS